ncbi:hypothetical protein BDM02DRAFT_3190066 [Thelephora ganbajun]|uniref:Uncharacterized protein n=1 Tax=Thelephora ganbajun TaxID=370292 RepID=A0ACB6Z6N8_THEGA|nr:hypothetical protein BDM02DRAFT_3190066 [Thelephora ganbajun]
MASPETKISHPIPQYFTAPNTPKASLFNLTTARLFAHLTPSPNTCASYIQGQDLSPSVTEPFRNVSVMTQIIKCDQQYVSSFMTPESSPLLVRTKRSPLSQHTNSPSSPRQTSSTPKPGSEAATPARIRQTSPLSPLSSPFVERNLTEEPTPTKITTPQKSTQLSPSPVSSLSPAFMNDVFSKHNVRTQPPLIVPPPLRVLSSETNPLADPYISKIEETELHRPDYLKWARRTPSPLASSSLLGDPFSHSPTSLGVTETPARGRRLKFFQETSEESFEESLMINGYVHHSGLSHNGQLSQTTLDWLRHPTSATFSAHQSHSLTVSSNPLLSDASRTENETRKRKRLESFLTPTPRTSKLRIVDVESRGRILLNAEEEASLHETLDGGNPVRQKRPVDKRKLKGNGNGKESPSKRDVTAPPDSGPVGPDWLDAEFPWSLKVDQLVRAYWETQAEKIRGIEKFLDRDSDSESEGEEIMPSSAWGELYQHPPMPCRRGRGKMVPIKATDRRRVGTMVFPSDPADARAALLSRRAVRTLILRRASHARHSNILGDGSGSGEDEDSCVCGGKVKDSGLVQCDDCERWYHLRCIGVSDVGELGGPNDPWYCTGCMKDTRRTVTPEPIIPSSEPTIVPTDDDCPGSSPKDPLFFVGDSERSPFPTWRPRARLSTPTRGSAAFEPLSGSSSTAYSNKGDPSTPQSSGLARIYETPNLFINVGGGESAFDLTTTPSRGMKFNAFTPKSIGPWSDNSRTNTTGLGFHTPPRKHTGSVNRTMGRVDSVSGVALRPVLQDSPTWRKEGAIARVLHSRRLYESPMSFGSLTSGGRFSGFPMLEESPVARSAGKKRMREEADLGDGVSAEE